MTERAPRTRPAYVKPPAHLSPSPPVPAPAPVAKRTDQGGSDGLDPTRYGDWVHKGIAIDF